MPVGDEDWDKDGLMGRRISELGLVSIICFPDKLNIFAVGRRGIRAEDRWPRTGSWEDRVEK